MLEIPYVPKVPVSLVVIGNTGLEPVVLRSVMESFNFRVETHWTGSRHELVKILQGEIATYEHLVLSCHGDSEQGGAILLPYEPVLFAAELGTLAKLTGKMVLNLGCATGMPMLAEAFLMVGCAAYTAPTDFVDGNAALFFAIHYFYFLAQGKSLAEAVEQARQHDDQCGLFSLFAPLAAT